MSDFIPFNPTPEQRANLERLAAHLSLGVTNRRFDMEHFSDADHDPYEECGTVACAAGHGPSLGIAALPNETWAAYVPRVFIGGNAPAYDWLFGGGWHRTDNTPAGAAERIRVALKDGIPSNCYLQMLGNKPLSYTIPTPVEGPVIPVRERVS